MSLFTVKIANNDLSVLPKHIAIIMDGNGRWAETKGSPRSYGHKVGTKKLQEIVSIAVNLKINYLTLYAFSNENWQRPKNEVDCLMKLIKSGLDIDNFLNDNNIKLQILGNIYEFPVSVSTHLERCLEETCNNTGLNLSIALNYSSKLEILDSVKNIAERIEKKQLTSNEITEQLFSEYFYVPSLPDVDFLIRTGGEYRLSNFMLWQCSYAELYFTPILWPDFTENDFCNAILEYQKRNRRFGKIN